MDINEIVKITSRAWSLSILAHIFNGVPGRQAPLLAASGATRTAFAQSLTHLIELGLLERNPGHGHPLRPEFRLTATGKEFAAMAGKIESVELGQTPAAILRKTWTVPVLAVCQRPRYFSEIKGQIPTVTDRALSLSLQNLHARQWLRRDIDETSKLPRPLYSVENAGAEVSLAVNLLGEQ